MTNEEMQAILKREFGRDWKHEALFYYRKYLVMRQRFRHLQKLYRQCRKVLVRILLEK